VNGVELGPTNLVIISMKRDPVIEVIDDQMAEIYRRMTPAQRLARANEMWKYARRRLVALLAEAHPEWNLKQINDEVCLRMIGLDPDPGSR
jgi:hypothetical protein